VLRPTDPIACRLRTIVFTPYLLTAPPRDVLGVAACQGAVTEARRLRIRGRASGCALATEGVAPVDGGLNGWEEELGADRLGQVGRGKWLLDRLVLLTHR
jgi:hypothetical protein